MKTSKTRVIFLMAVMSFVIHSFSLAGERAAGWQAAEKKE